MVNAFAGIWFVSQGLTPEQIGTIAAAPLFVLLFLGIIVGRIADAAPDWRRVIVIGSVVSGVLPFSLLFVGGYWGILIAWTMCVIAQMAVLPVVDAASIRLGRRVGFDFSHLYAWKTIGYLLTVFTAGIVIDRFGIIAFLPVFIGLSLVRAASSFALPAFRAPVAEAMKKPGPRNLREMSKLWFVLPLAGWSMVHATHFVLNGFLGLFWQAQGVSEDYIGALVAVSSLSEIVMFFVFKHFAERFSARAMILVSCLVAAIRLTAFSASPSVEILFALQMLHSITYALGFLACTNFIANQTREEVAAEAQSFFVLLQLVVAIVALVSFGWLAAAFGPYAFLASASLAALGALLVVISMTLKK